MQRKPQCFLIFSRQSRQSGGPELPFPSTDFRLVRPAPAITYILTPILTTDSTPNYHVPSMTILQAHPQLQPCRYLKTRQRRQLPPLLHSEHYNQGGLGQLYCVFGCIHRRMLMDAHTCVAFSTTEEEATPLFHLVILDLCVVKGIKEEVCLENPHFPFYKLHFLAPAVVGLRVVVQDSGG